MLQEILDKHGRRKESLIPILQAVQKEYRYLPRKVLREICRETEITPSDIVGVSTFYDQFRHEPTGEHTICVCTGTACHVKGADRVLDAFYQTLGIPTGEDTDRDRKFTIQKVACLGCCTLAPVVQIDGVTYGHVTTATVSDVLEDFKSRSTGDMRKHDEPPRGTEIETVRIGLGSCCQAQGSAAVRDEVLNVIDEMNLDIRVEAVGCVGMCHQTPLLEAISKKGISTFYAKVKPEDIRSILLRNYRPKNFLRGFQDRLGRLLETLWSDEFPDPARQRLIQIDEGPVRSFLGRQRHFAMEHCGEIDPTDLNDYRRHGGFAALERILNENVSSEKILAELEASGIRGRGGAGFPTFRKWRAVLTAPTERGASPPGSVTPSSDLKYVVCNGDEGDPGAFMDRMLLESFPFRIIEGMTIAARAVGASRGFFYIRAEYPLAVERIRRALKICYDNGFLGENISGADFSFDLSVKEGAGAFVCGEETALLESMEGRRGMPRLRPPFPAQAGLFGKPTLVNNVETYSLIPYVFKHGAEAFVKFGTEKSRGTKVFALAGKVRRGGLIEVPMGVTIRQVVEEIGGGVADGRRFKAVQIGGPSGGCVPAGLADTPIDFESLSRVGAIMGSGGLVVLDEDDCMVDIARYFLAFTQEQSCGKCTFCRIGTRRMLDILDRLCRGEGRPDDLEHLETLAEQVKAGSLCGLGKTAPNPVLSTLKYFRDEYEAHLLGLCPAGKCTAMIEYRINDRCNGCSICARACPVEAIPVTPYQQHGIRQNLCTKCDACRSACPHGAVLRGAKHVEPCGANAGNP